MQHAIRVAALFCLFAFTAIFPANAQQAAIVTTCGAQSLGHAVFGSSGLYIDQTGNLCVAASVSASITGFPGSTQTTGTPISVTTGGVTGTLPSGAVVVASNVGATNGAYCKLGASATTSDQLIAPNSWFAFTVGSNTQLTCITSTSTTTVNMVGGAGLPTGAGGGGGGGGSSGAVFGPTAVGSAAANPPVLIAGTANAGATGNVQVAKVSASGLVSTDGSAVTQPVSGAAAAFANGASVAQGSTTDVPCTLPSSATACSEVAVQKAIANAVNSAVPVNVNGTPTALTGVTPGSAQTGTIVGANEDLTSVGGTAILHGTGTVGAGALRVAVGVDSATNAGSAPVKGGVAVVNGGSTYNTVAASQTTQALTSGGGGATGDYLSHCVVQPTTTAAGTVTIFDNTTTVFTFTTGTLSNLVPFAIPVGANSVSGAWKITTGANETVTCVGKFT